MTLYRHDMPFGAQVEDEGVRFRLWAPGQSRIDLLCEQTIRPMNPLAEGWFELVVPEVSAGACYRYCLANGQQIPDPASRFQPLDVEGPSAVLDPYSYRWKNDGWKGRPWHETILYELHVGAFSQAGTYRGVEKELDRLAKLGITAIELMPLADFPGRRNWGYDGVLPFAPDHSYGTPDELKALIDDIHARGMMAFLDVVYNHFGPEGNYLSLYAPDFFTQRHMTPWGAAINFSDATVRRFFIENALYWLEEYRFDGLRFDAVHAIEDESERHILQDIAMTIRGRIAPDRHVHLVLENDDNEAHYLERDAGGAPRYFSAQWNDDFHHQCHVLLTGETKGYYDDYKDNRIARLGRALAEGFIYQGEASGFRGGAPRGEPSANLPPTAFVAFLQNHDQVGNRPFGERLTRLAGLEALRAMSAVLLLSPHIPLLFMGEEWGIETPFLFFCDFSGELGEAVRKGREKEFSGFFSAEAAIPDATHADSFYNSVLPAADALQATQLDHGRYIAQLIAIRRDVILPLLLLVEPGGTYSAGPGDQLLVTWPLRDGRTFSLAANLSNAAVPWTAPRGCDLIYATSPLTPESAQSKPPWSAFFFLDRLPDV